MPRARPGRVQIGLLGKANVGKSTFFSAATRTRVPTGNFPFTTVRPNVGVAHVRAECACRSLGVEHDIPECDGGTRLIPVGLIDVAGLVPGAHEGRGLGNKFLDDARQADALIHVVDAAGATDEQGQPVPPGTRDPADDARFVEEEIDAWFSGILEREWPRLSREVEQKASRAEDGIARRFSGLGVSAADVRAALRARGLESSAPAGWSAADRAALTGALRRRTKPILVAANKADLCADPAAAASGLGGAGRAAVPCSAEAELLLVRAAEAGLVEYSPGSASFSEVPGSGASGRQKAALGAVAGRVMGRMGGTGVQAALDSAAFGLLGLVEAYPVEDEAKFCSKDGDVLPDARLMPPGSTVLDLARSVHADMADGFLHGIDCRTGRRIGAERALERGDVVKIVSALGRGGG